MEKVKVVKPIPGILEKGDILISPIEGADFCLEETKVTKKGSSERYVSLDYVTVSENIPEFFVFDQAEEESDSECYFCGNCDDCDCTCTEEELKELDIELPFVQRTDDEIQARYDFFNRSFINSFPGSEAQVVYRNLMWFIEWLNGKAEILY